MNIISQTKKTLISEEEIKKKRLLNSNQMEAIYGLVLLVVIPRKSLSMKEKIASGFPSYDPKIQNQNIQDT
jgi:hypothetical protein